MKKILIFIILSIILNSNSINILHSQTLKLNCSKSVYAYGQGFFSKDDKYYYYSELNVRGNQRKYIAIRNLENCELEKTIEFHAFEQEEVYDFNLHNLDLHQKMIFVVLNKLYFYDFNSNNVVDSIIESNSIQQLSVSVYQYKIAYFISEKDSLNVKILNLYTKKFENNFTINKMYSFNKVYFSPDLEKIYFAGNYKDEMNSYLTVWSIKNGTQDTTINVAPRKINNLATSNDSKYLLLSAEDGKVYVINKFNYLIENVIDNGNLVSHLNFLKNPNYCLIGTNNNIGSISIYSLIENKEIFSSNEFHNGSNYRLSYLNNYLIETFYTGINLEMRLFKFNINGISGLDESKFETNESKSSIEFKIFDIYGKLIKSGIVFNQIEFENLATGIYFLNEKFTNHQSIIRKIVIKN